MPPSGNAKPIKTPGACTYFLRHYLLQFATCTGCSSLAVSAIQAFWLSTQLHSHFSDDSMHVQGHSRRCDDRTLSFPGLSCGGDVRDSWFLVTLVKRLLIGIPSMFFLGQGGQRKGAKHCGNFSRMLVRTKLPNDKKP